MRKGGNVRTDNVNLPARSPMKKILLFTLLTSLFSLHAHADWDAAAEAREDAKRKAAQQQEARKKAEVDKMLREANVKAMRGQMGKEAVGKSDAEVEKLYRQRMAEYQRQGAAAAASGATMARQLQKLDADTRPQRDAQMKGMTGKSISELEKMSDKDLEAFSREMEKKFGGG